MAVQKEHASQNPDAEPRAVLDEMWRRLRVFSKQAATIPSDERGSFEWLAAAGAFWWAAREAAGLSREDVARQAGITVNKVRFLEFGLPMPRELTERRLRPYASALGEPELYDQYRARFES